MRPRRWEPHCAAEGLVVYQPRPGYRFTSDPVLLAGWMVEAGLPPRVLDVGTGSGILGLLLANQGAEVTGVDIQEEWRPWAERSAAESGLEGRYRFECADIRGWRAGRFDLAVCNPPYFPMGSGPVSSDPMRAAARHGLHGDIPSLIASMAALAPRVAMVLPLDRLDRARSALLEAGLGVVRTLRLAPRLALVEGGMDGAVDTWEDAALRSRGAHHPRVRALYRAVRAPLSEIGADDLPRNAIGG